MIIGLTGSFGSGKTTVANMFKRLGAYVIDADKVCHSLMRSSETVQKKILKAFNTLDRRKIRQVVFRDRKALTLLNKIMHPEAIKAINRIIRHERKRKVILVDAALLIESGYYKKMDKIIVVKIGPAKDMNRIIKEKKLSRHQASRILKMQSPLGRKLRAADFIIDNSGSRRSTYLQVIKIWRKIGERYANT